MTNAEKYLRDGVDIEKFAEELIYYIDNICSEPQDIYPIHIKNFFKKQVKPTLSEDEKVILKNVSIDFRYIRREQNGALYFCLEENKGCVSNIFANGLFDCIQPRRRI